MQITIAWRNYARSIKRREVLGNVTSDGRRTIASLFTNNIYLITYLRFASVLTYLMKSGDADQTGELSVLCMDRWQNGSLVRAAAIRKHGIDEGSPDALATTRLPAFRSTGGQAFQRI